MDLELRVELKNQEDQLKDLYLRGKLTHPEFHKGLVSVALQWAGAGDVQTALDMVERIPESYFLGEIAKQMEEDPKYLSVAGQLSVILSLYANHAELAPTQKEAQA